MGWWTPATGVTPGMRRPVRTMTLPPIASRRMRLGLPTSSAPSGVIVAALRPEARLRHALGRLFDDRVVRLAPVFEREIEALDLYLDAEDLGVEKAQRLLEQLLSGLVPVERNNAKRLHGTRRYLMCELERRKSRIKHVPVGV